MTRADLSAGEFRSWLTAVRAAIAGEADSIVPCDGCAACCTSSQFVHIEPDETATLARIPAALVFPAPGRPPGHVVLGYDERGHCPMLVDGRCSIYEDRPRTCRTYDCRVFTATGLEPDKELIAARTARWQFRFEDDEARVHHDAVHAAARFVHEHARDLPEAAATDPTQLAVLAIAVHDEFVAPGERVVAAPDVDAVRVAITRRLRAS